MKQIFRRFLCCIGVFAMAFCLVFGLVGCDEKNYEEEETQTEEILSGEAGDDNEGILSPKSAVEIYLAQKDLWMERPEYEPMIGYGYCLLDFDFDGVLELVNSVTDGSARFTTNKFYRINQETLQVEEFSLPRVDEEGGVDYYYMAQDAKLYKNNSDGSMFYLWSSYIRISVDEGAVTKTETRMESGRVVEKAISTEYWYPDYDNNMAEIREYTFKNKEVSKAEFEKAFDDYYKQNKDLNLTFGYIEGASFDKGTASEQKRLLTEAYEKFSYDGFSF